MTAITRRPVLPTQFSCDIHPLLQRVYAIRGAVSDKDIDYGLKNLLPPTQLKGLSEAIDLLVTAIQNQQRVLIVGDFDADGATSCALSLLALKAMGLQSIEFLVPNRFEYGYGLTPEIVDVAKGYQPDLIITVDNGIASVAGVAKAKQWGIKVLITDHHLPPDQLPDADAIVNPNQQGCEFPSKNLAGVGVIFYVLSAVRSALREAGWFEAQQLPEPVMANYLDLVALGTVADVVPLDRNNRVLVYQGLQRLRAGKARPGIVALLQVAAKDYQQVASTDLGFIIGPRLNAAGRLDDISVGIQCLLTDDHSQAYELASDLDALNRERRAIESSMQREALKSLADIEFDTQQAPAGICLYEESWHQGVVGILASRVKEKYHRPVIAFAPSNTDEHEIKGSARSISALHIRDTLDAIATANPDVLQKFGGHAMAAGLTLHKDHYHQFCELFNQAVHQQLTPADFQEVLLSDGELSATELDLSTAYALQQAGPWGQQFPEPVFDGEFVIVQQRLVGEKHLKLVLALDEQAQHTVDAIAFNVDLTQWPNQDVERMQAVYELTVNRFRGEESVQLILRYLNPL